MGKPTFTKDEIRMLVGLERKMDAGEQPFIRDHAGHRIAFPKEVLDDYGAVSGQTITDPIVITELMKASHRRLQAEIIARDVEGGGDG
jgi:hypothetical protein